MRFGSLFTGIGGFDLGFERAGMECAWQVEIDAACQDVERRHWPNVKRFGDVRNVGKSNLDSVDVICGGFPCQDLSVAGKRAGLAGERSGLWYEFHRILAELKPQWVVIENVPGLLSSNAGQDFAAVLRGLVELRYGVCWRILDAQYFGVAQRRRRVFIVGSLGDGRAAQVLFERESGAGDTPPSREAGARLAATVTSGPDSPESHGKPSGRSRDLNLIALAFTERTRAEGRTFEYQDDVAYALTNPGSGGRTHSRMIAYSTNDIENWREGIGALPARNGKDAGNGIVVNSIESSDGGTDENDAIGGRLVAAPLTASPYADNESQDSKLVAFDYCLQGSERTWIHRGDGYAQLQANRPDAVAGNFGVRRLTPVECERLQGLPDGWTAGQSDSVRYRQLGNAVCMPVAEWVGRRLSTVGA